VAPIPGKNTIGIEVPNSEKQPVRLRELMELAGNAPQRMELPLFLGKDASGNPLICDLTRMPHSLIAGTTGSGKSVCINSIILSMLLTQRPDYVKMIMVDPKMVEMSMYKDVPHLMCPVVTDVDKAQAILEWLVQKMEERYAVLSEAQVRNIQDYNKLGRDALIERMKPADEEEANRILTRLPYIVLIIDELADLMMVSPKEVELCLARLAQKSRAVGIHMILATQRPEAKVVTGLIKSNLPSRIAFRVNSRLDSRIVLDQNGAEDLLGQGDMLFLPPGKGKPDRAQGTLIEDAELRRVLSFLAERAQPQFSDELMQIGKVDLSAGERDEMFDEAVRIVLASRRGSVSLLQRKLAIGYSRASRLIEQMGAAGIVGDYKGSQAREVMMTLEEYEDMRGHMQQEISDGLTD
jgi:S-DNA-T family DNA segregation ATPase FtsK/SpoIIIE